MIIETGPGAAKFIPVKIVITLENQEELNAIRNLLGCYIPATVMKFPGFAIANDIVTSLKSKLKRV